ncbi:MAG: VOC family protein [Betaproteobacteria bacterium]|nr:MAG: VOC family protein [Betaproteobacteria bacterium]
MGEAIAFDHVHLISRDPQAAAKWYQEMFGGKVTAVQENLRGAPQIDVRVGGMTIVIRGQRPGEEPIDTKPMQHFDGFSSHDEWGTDHFGFTYRGDLMAFCDELKKKGVQMAVEPWEFKPGMVLCYVAAPDGVSIELIQASD